MARRTFDVVDVTEIFIHWYAGRSLSEVAVSLGVDRKTIRKYLAPALAAGLAPGGPVMAQQDWAELVMCWFPQLVDTPVAAGDVAGDRGASRLHRGDAQGRRDAGDDPSAAA
jgi:hypothetical protein